MPPSVASRAVDVRVQPISSGIARPAFRMPLRYRADMRSILFLLFYNALFLVQWTGAWRWWPLLVLSCVLAFTVFIIKHNHIHCPTFRTRAWNRFFELWLSLCTGQSIAAIIPVHNERHHAHSQSDLDLVRSSLVAFKSNWLNLLAFPVAVVTLVHRNKRSDLARWQREQPALYRRARFEQACVAFFWVLLLLLNWRATLVYFAVPCLFGQWGIVTINLLQHQDCDQAAPHDQARNFTGRALNWLFLNNGFHTAHHLAPRLHWSRLSEYHRRHLTSQTRPDLNQPSFLLYLWRDFARGNRHTTS